MQPDEYMRIARELASEYRTALDLAIAEGRWPDVDTLWERLEFAYGAMMLPGDRWRAERAEMLVQAFHDAYDAGAAPDVTPADRSRAGARALGRGRDGVKGPKVHPLRLVEMYCSARRSRPVSEPLRRPIDVGHELAPALGLAPDSIRQALKKIRRDELPKMLQAPDTDPGLRDWIEDALEILKDGLGSRWDR